MIVLNLNLPNFITKLLTVSLIFLLNLNPIHAQIDSTYFEIQTNENGDPIYFKHQIIIAFSPNLLKKSVIDNKEFIHGKLADYFTEDAITIATSLGIWNNDIADAPTSKIYPFLDSDDTLSLTSSGETITIPKYWATLLVYWPVADSTPILQVCDSLSKFYPIIEFAHPNYLYHQNSVPNDAFYYLQFSFHPELSIPLNANINIENAWDIETGSPDIKLGVFDSPIMYNHEDFGGGTFATSKIKGGKVYYTNAANNKVIEDISTYNLGLVPNNHGTRVAGVAAAIRNNEKGIAGIAGGDFTQGNLGTSLYSFGIFSGTYGTYCSDDVAGPAIVEAAQHILQPNGTYTGYGLDIENHSWGGPPSSINIRRAIKGAARNQCVLVCSRGNNDDIVDPKDGNDIDNYPATYNDEWVISVGASGTDKKRLSILRSNVGEGIGHPYSSMYGKAMDVLAPGSKTIVFTTIDEIVENKDPNSNSCIWTNYCDFDGTSAAAAHVSGLAALLLSKYRSINGFQERLEPEDVENLVENYAIHNAPSPSFYNDKEGWGLINPDNTLDKIKDNRYKVYHFTDGWPKTTTNMGNITINIPVPSVGTPGLFGLTSGNHIIQRWKIEESYTNTFGSNEQILGYWPRLNATNGLKDFSTNALTDDEHASYTFSQTGSTLTVTATTYAYKNTSTGLWLNYEPNKVKTAYSVHTFDPTKSNINETIIKTVTLRLYPNPASKQVIIELGNLQVENLNITDMNGILQNTPFLINTKSIVLDTSNLPEGFYICKSTLSNGTIAINKLLIVK